MSDPVLIAVEDDPAALRDLEDTLRDRYGRSLPGRVHSLARRRAVARSNWPTPTATTSPWCWRARWLDGTTGSDLLDELRRLHPQAKRALLIGWGDWGDSRSPARRSSTRSRRGRIDHYVLRPSPPPDELFHHAVSGLLLDWAETQRTSPYTDPHRRRVVVGRGPTSSGSCSDAARCRTRSTSPIRDDGRALVEQAGAEGELAARRLPRRHGPARPHQRRARGGVGLAGATPSAGLRPRDRRRRPRRAVGGGVRRVGGLQHAGRRRGRHRRAGDVELADPQLPRVPAGRQRSPTSPSRRTSRPGSSARTSRSCSASPDLGRDGDGLARHAFRHRPVTARAVLLATGASYRRLGVPELEALNGAGVFYGSRRPPRRRAWRARDVYVVGGANSAGQAALHLVRFAVRVTLVVRGDVARGRACRTTWSARSRRHRTWRCDSAPRWSAAAATAASSTWCSADARRARGDRRRRRAVPDDRRAAAHRLVAARDRAGRAGLRAHRPRSRRPTVAARTEPVPVRDERARRVRGRRRAPRLGEAGRVGGR